MTLRPNFQTEYRWTPPGFGNFTAMFPWNLFIFLNSTQALGHPKPEVCWCGARINGRSLYSQRGRHDGFEPRVSRPQTQRCNDWAIPTSSVGSVCPRITSTTSALIEEITWRAQLAVTNAKGSVTDNQAWGCLILPKSPWEESELTTPQRGRKKLMNTKI